MVIQEEHFPSAHFIRYSGYPFPHTVISSAARNLPCTLLFLASFAKGFPFSALSCSLRRSIPVFCYHTYGAILVCKKDPSTSLGMTLRKWRFPNISFIRDVGYLFPPYHHFERRREILLALCSSLPLSRKASNFTLSHIRRYTGVQERSRASVGMTIRKRRFPNISFIRDVGYPSPPYRHFERSEKSSLHSALSCFLRRWIPLPCCRT